MPNEFKGGLNRFNPFASYTLTRNRILNDKNVQKRKIVEIYENHKYKEN